MRILIDGDVILYLAVATAEHETVGSAAQRFHGICTDIAEAHFADDSDSVEIFFSGGANFRKTVYPVYKSNRKAKPSLIEPLKSWCLEHMENTFLCDGYEADDELLIRACEAEDNGETWSIATVDKDLRTHPGRFYDVRKQEHTVVTPGQAYTFMIQQFVMGDSVDGIAGIRGWGPAKTSRLINDGNTLWENLQTAKEIWSTNYGQPDYKEKFEETCNLAFIRRRRCDLQPLEFWDMPESELRSVLRVRV